jgi:hypothetical protein
MYVDESEVANARGSKAYIFMSKRVVFLIGALVASIIVGCILITHFATVETSRGQLAQCKPISGKYLPNLDQLENECKSLMCQNPLSANGKNPIIVYLECV